MSNNQSINKKPFEKIFSLKNSNNRAGKILTILGLEFHFFNYFGFLKHCCVAKNYLTNLEKAKEVNEDTFEKYRNLYTGKNIAILAPGMTAKYVDINDSVIKIGTNRAYKFFNNLDYLFVHDISNNGQDILDNAIKLNCIKFFWKFVNGYDNDNSISMEDILKTNAKIYYTRNRLIAEHDSTIFKDITKHPLFDGGTIVHPALNFALFTNPKKIYLIGCDCSNSGYADGSKQNYKLNFDLFYNGYTIIKNFAAYFYPETEIISVNPMGLKGLFKDVYTQGYINAHPEVAKENIEIIGDIV